MRSSKIFLCFLLAFIGGVFVASFWKVPKVIIYELFCLGVLYSILFFREKAVLVFGGCLIILALGVLRTSQVKIFNSNPNLKVYFPNLVVKFIKFLGKIHPTHPV